MKKFTLFFIFYFILTVKILPDHGPATSVSGTSVQGAAMTNLHHLDIGINSILTEFNQVSNQRIEELTKRLGNVFSHYEAIEFTTLSNLTLSYGISERFSASASMGYFSSKGIREGLLDSNLTYYLIDVGDVGGLSDTWLNLRFLLIKDDGSLTLSGGVKLPTGKSSSSFTAIPLSSLSTGTKLMGPGIGSHVTDAQGDGDDIISTPAFALEPAMLPGSGSYDFSGGLAYTRSMGKSVFFSSSLNATIRTTANNFRVGHLFEWGFSIRNQLNEGKVIWFAYIDITLSYMVRSLDRGEAILNSGGFWAYFSPAIGMQFNQKTFARLQYHLPSIQLLNGEQVFVDHKVSLQAAYTLHLF